MRLEVPQDELAELHFRPGESRPPSDLAGQGDDLGDDWLAPHEGRPPVFSDAAVRFCPTIKVLFKLSLRQTIGMVSRRLRMADLDRPVPDCLTLSRRQKALAVQIPYRRADGALNLLVDIEFRGDGEWQARKSGPQGRHQWRKVHPAMDTATSDIRAVGLAPSREGDSPMPPELPGQIPEGEAIGTVTADGAGHPPLLLRDHLRPPERAPLPRRRHQPLARILRTSSQPTISPAT